MSLLPEIGYLGLRKLCKQTCYFFTNLLPQAQTSFFFVNSLQIYASLGNLQTKTAI